MQAADGEVARLQQGAEGLKQERQKGLIEMRKATQQWAVAQADLRSTRHQLKVLQAQVPLLLLDAVLLLLPPPPHLVLLLLLLLFLLLLHPLLHVGADAEHAAHLVCSMHDWFPIS